MISGVVTLIDFQLPAGERDDGQTLVGVGTGPLHRRRPIIEKEVEIMPGEQSVILTLSGDEALVLFDWLARSSDTGVPAPFVDQAEARVLWHVEAVLERSLVAPLRADYDSLLNAARRAVRDESDSARG